MNSIAFIDTEIEPESRRILDIGGVRDNGSQFHSNSIVDFIDFFKGSQFVCGHNIINHDLKYIQNAIVDAGINPTYIIDTLFLSPLFFPSKPYHALLKDDKLQTEDSLKQILYSLLNDKIEFKPFFSLPITKVMVGILKN